MSRIVRAGISVEALNHNYREVKKLTNGKQVLAMVKANGYGHGLISIAKALSADALGVARLEEGILLKEAGIKTPVVLMEGCFSKEELRTALHHHFQIVVHAPYQVAELLALKEMEDAPFQVWVKVNTGMNRLGFSSSEFQSAWDALNQQKNIQILGIMTHFAKADEKASQATMLQNHTFEALVKSLPGLKSAANSAAILAWPDTHYDWVRPGLMLYGASPFAETNGKDFNLKPVMRLTTEIIALHDLAAGMEVGYGGTYRCEKPSRIAVAAIGYGDGYPWGANQAPVWVEGKRTHLVGRVSMDMISIDVTNIPEAKLGSEVELWGSNMPVEDVAKACKTLPYELFTRLTSRVKFEMI